MHLQSISLFVVLSGLGVIHALPTAEEVDVTYHYYYENGTMVEETVKEPLDSRFVEVSQSHSLNKRAFNKFFDWSNSKEDQDRIGQIQGAQRDGVEIAEYARDNIDKDGIYGHYFGPNDKANVKKVYENIVGPNKDGTGSDALGQVYWDKKDFKNKCTPAGKEKAGKDVVVAYAGNGKAGGKDISLNHMCDQGYKFKRINDVKCDELGDTVSTKMDILGGVLLHEWTHFKTIAGFLPGAPDGTKDNAYGPLKVRALSDADKLVNADSYCWFAQEMFWHITCDKTYSGPRDSRDTDQPECGKGKCTVQ